MTKGQIDNCFRGAGAMAVVMLFCSGLFFRCANITTSIEGGPRDSLPPRVVRMTPAYNATGIRPEEVVIEFDEMVQLKDMSSEFFTSPFMETKPVVSVRGKKAIVTIDSPLEDTITYVFNLGSGVVDNNEGNPIHGLKYTFSPGGHIDSMYMSGYVSDALTADTMRRAYIFFYPAALDTVPGRDSLLFNTHKASAVTRTLTDGGFVFPNLKPIDYRIYALVDKNNNTMYDPGTDAVAFLDSVQNPTRQPSFRMWYDSTRMHVVAQPQLFFRTFVEEAQRPQNLTNSSRPAAQQILVRFASPDPVIERFTLNDIPAEKILTEYLKPTRDSIAYWLDVPADELPDTLRGTIVYERPDSAGQLYLHEQELRLVWNNPARPRMGPAARAAADRPLSPRQQRRAERASAEAEAKARADSLAAAELADSLQVPADSLTAPADTVPPSKMKFAFSKAEPVIPGTPPVLTFELPLRRLGIDSIRLFRLEADSTEIPVEFELVSDSLAIRDYTIRSAWEDGRSYRLFIPSGALETIDGERNDSISQALPAAKQADMGSITLTLDNPPGDYEYIMQVTDEQGQKVIREMNHLGMGTHEIGYLTRGKLRLRLIEDRNRNGRWDTGNLIRRVQPEVIAWYRTDSLSIDLQGAVELDSIDVTAIFRPRVLEDTPADVLPAEGDEGPDGDVLPIPDVSRQADIPYPEPGQPYQTSEPRVEGFELTDPKAVRKAEKATRRAARAAEKEANRAARREYMDNLPVVGEEHDHEDHAH